MRHHLPVSLILGAAVCLSAAGPTKIPEPGTPYNPRTYVCARASVPVVVDGEVDEPAWNKAPWSDAFVDIEGAAKPKPRLRTMVKMLWDDDYFYIAGYLEEPDLWATLTERDSIIFQDNDFEVFIDPDGDTHDYYELEMNALNTVWDLLLVRPYRDGGPAIHAWDIRGLKTAVKLVGTLNRPGDKDKSWFVEIALPWEILKEAADPKASPKPGDRWRVEFSRVEYRLDVKDGAYVKRPDAQGRPLAEDNWVWSPTGLINIHYPEMWAFVQFSGAVAGQSREAFRKLPEDEAKWALRRIYYRQWALRAEKGSFAPDWKSLGLRDKDFKLKGFAFPPAVRAAGGLFEAFYTAPDGTVWRIVQDGRVAKGE
ncbi:MAG: carbohydrate-binding family 9-like protein [Acidobacteriota bacterium]|nr:carbohydrate-binding family 9-like protein [Acidobacteriota bacterium]